MIEGIRNIGNDPIGALKACGDTVLNGWIPCKSTNIGSGISGADYAGDA